MKGSSRLAMKEESTSVSKSRIGTRSTGRINISPTKSRRIVKSASSSPHTTAPRRLRSVSPASTLGKLRTKKARLETDRDTPRPPRSSETTPRHAALPNADQGQQGSQSTPGSQSTAKGAGIRTRLSTGSIQMNGTMTISAAKEKAEMDQIIKQIAKSDTVVATKTPTTGVRKRVVQQTTMQPGEGMLADHPPPKKRKIGRNDGSGEDNRNDYFCWLCHKEGMLVCCELCPRVYHTRCLGLSAALPQDWVCPECEKLMRAECVDTRSKAMEMLTLEQLCTLLKYALERMQHAGSEPFQRPVDINAVPNYSDYIFHPMDLTTLEKNIKKKMYGCTEALLADAKWILHNCIIYNGAHSKFTSSAKMIVKICKHEMNEIELCPDCYLNSCVRKNDEWFSDTCRVPHTLVWAKLKGYPFWPSKALREVDGQVDVRFFGAHDRSWVSVSQCFLLSKNIPTSLQKGKKNNGLDMAIEELNLHVKKLREKFGSFEYAPFRTPYDKTDSYKPVSLKSDVSSKPNTVFRLSQNRESKIGSSSSLTSNKPNILRKSAVAKIRNKYSAMVTFKKLETSPEKGKKKYTKEEVNESDSYFDNEKGVEANMSEKSDSEAVEPEGKTKQPGDVVDAAKDLELNNCLKDKKTIEERTKEKGIKKSFVSSNLIEQIENKLKGLVEEPVENDTDVPENSTEKKSKLDESGTKQEVKETSNPEIPEKTIESEKSSETKNDSDIEVKNASGNEPLVADKLEEKALSNINQEKNENENTDCLKVDLSTQESKDSYRMKLDTMIKSCKEKLGMDNEEAADIDSAISDNEDDDSSDDVDDDDDESDEESGESESEEASRDGKEKEENEMDFESADSSKDSVVDGKNEQEKTSSENGKVEENKKEMDDQQKCESVSENIINDKSSSNTSCVQKTPTSESKHVDKETESKEKQHKEDLEPMEPADEEEETEISQIDRDTDKKLSVEEPAKIPNTSDEQKGDTCEIIASSLHEVLEGSGTAKLDTESVCKSVNSDELKSVSGESLGQFSGEIADKTDVDDEDSDSDRLVIDLHEESYKKHSKKNVEGKHNEVRRKSHTSLVDANLKADTCIININDETRKAQKRIIKQKLSAELKDSVVKSKDKEPKTKSNDVTDRTPSNKPIARSQSVDAKERAHSNKLADRTQSEKSAERALSIEQEDRTQSADSTEKTQSNEPEDSAQSRDTPENTKSNELDETQSKEQIEQAQSKETKERAQSRDTPEKNQSNEQMDISDDDDDDDDDGVEISSIPLDTDSSLPINLDSSLPDKNFVKPPHIDNIEEIPQSSKLAEKFSKKLLETIQKTVDEMCSEVLKEKSDTKTVELLNQKIHQARWNYCAELNELKHNFQLTMYEMKTGWESEKEQIVKALTAKHHAEKELAVKEAKKKQWCAQCGKEAIFYCCWNTSYCDYPCQQNHWPQHMHTCLQTNKDKTASSSSSSTSTPGQQGQSHSVSQSPASIPVSVGPSVTPQTSASVPTPSVETDHLRRLQENLTMALQREEEKRGETRPGVGPKFNPLMQNLRQPGPGSAGMMFNMQQSQPGVMQQIQRTRFLGQQQMAMQVQQRASLSQSQQQGNPRMLFSQPLVQQTVYPLQIQPQQQLAQQQLGGTILFQNPQQNLMTYGMAPRPY